MDDDTGEKVPAGLSPAINPRRHEAFEGMLRVVARGAIASIPVVGNGLVEWLNSADQALMAERVDGLNAVVTELVSQIGELKNGAETFALSHAGRRHIREVLLALELADDAEHLRALGHAFVSGVGLGITDPDRVQLLDATLRSLNTLHVRLLRCVADAFAGGTTAQERRFSVEEASAATGLHAALVQKSFYDLVQRGLALDSSVGKFGGYHGVLSVRVTPFGEDLVSYMTDASRYHLGAAPELRAPVPLGAESVSIG